VCWSRAADSPRPALNHAISNVYSKDFQKLLKYKYMDNVTDIVFLTLWNIYFLLFLALDMKGIINTLKMYYVAMKRADVVASTFATSQIRSCLLC